MFMIDPSFSVNAKDSSLFLNLLSKPVLTGVFDAKSYLIGSKGIMDLDVSTVPWVVSKKISSE